MKSTPENWWIFFTYDASHDVVDASFRDVVLENEEDVLCWRREVDKRFQSYGRQVDLIINLDGLIVRPSAARSFGQHRSQVLAEHTRCSFRFNGNAQTRTSIYTSSVIFGADANLFDSREEALKALLAFRQSGEFPSRTPLPPASQRAPLSQQGPPSVPPSKRMSLQQHLPADAAALKAQGPLSQRVPHSAAAPSTPRFPRQHSDGPASQRPPSSRPGSAKADSKAAASQAPASEPTLPSPGVLKK